MSQSERHAPSHALVVGGGTMGVGIIAMFLGGGWKVDVVSRSASTRVGLPDACASALAALGKPIVTLHDPDTTHALKEIDRAAMATAETPEQVVGVLRYVLEGKLPAGA